MSTKGSPPVDSKISCEIMIARGNELFLMEKFLVLSGLNLCWLGVAIER
jgi:hypothetical protein